MAPELTPLLWVSPEPLDGWEKWHERYDANCRRIATMMQETPYESREVIQYLLEGR